MVFQPAIPIRGVGGWRFLEATYDRQLQNFSKSPQIRNEREYMIEKFSQPISVEDFLKDSRLVKSTMTAFDLSGEEWKKGFIRKVLTEVGDPESTFLSRFNNPRYTAFARALAPDANGMIQLEESAVASMAVRFETNSFEIAVGDVDDNMRLALNFKSEISTIVANGASDDAIAFRLMADLPLYSVIKTALNLPESVSKLPVDRQAEMIKNGIRKTLGVSDISQIASPENTDRLLIRFHALKSVNEGVSSNSPASAALTILRGAAGGGGFGFGAQASQNLFLSGFR